MVAAFDLVLALLLIFVIFALVQRDPTPKALQTAGTYAVTIQWDDGSLDDIDLYVRDPAGYICFFAQPDIGLLHLEYDNLGHRITSGVTQTGEVTIIRGVEAGEYVVNVHAYQKYEAKPDVVIVTLYRLAGADTELYKVRVVLDYQGDEATAFRFVVRENGSVGGFSDLPLQMVRATL